MRYLLLISLIGLLNHLPYLVPALTDESDMPQRFAIDKLNRPEFLAVRDTISFAEGTWDADNNRPGYSYRYGDARNSGGTLDITQPHPIEARPSPWGGSSGSNASGAYQYLDSTWSEMNDGQNAVMSPANQDRALHRTLTERVGYDFDQPFDEQVHSLAPTWASFPNEQGVSHYDQPVKDAAMLNNHYQQRLDFHNSQLTPTPAIPVTPAPVQIPSFQSGRGAGRAAFQ